MGKFSLLLLCFVFQLSYSHTGLIGPRIYVDTLANETTTARPNLDTEKSNSFINELEKKFPEVKNGNPSNL